MADFDFSVSLESNKPEHVHKNSLARLLRLLKVLDDSLGIQHSEVYLAKRTLKADAVVLETYEHRKPTSSRDPQFLTECLQRILNAYPLGGE